MNSLVSVCMPTYNAERTIGRTMESVLAQTYTPLEILVSDDGSADGTVGIVREFMRSDGRIRLYENKDRQGMVQNWNSCISHARGKYVQCVFQDDIIFPRAIERKSGVLDSDEGIMLAFSSSQIINERDDVLMTRRPFRGSRVLDGKKLARRSFLTRNIYGEPSNVLFRRSAAEEAGLFSTNVFYAADWDMWLRLSCMGRVGFLPEVLMQFRISGFNATSTFDYKKFGEDDGELVRNITGSGMLRLNQIDILVHKVMQHLRMHARNMYIRRKTR